MGKEERKRKRSPSLKKLNAQLKEVQEHIAKKLKEDGVQPDDSVRENADLINDLLEDTSSPPRNEEPTDSGMFEWSEAHLFFVKAMSLHER